MLEMLDHMTQGIAAAPAAERKAEPFRSAMSMLNFYINRAGSGLSAEQKAILQRAKEELRHVFHRPSAAYFRNPTCHRILIRPERIEIQTN